MSALIQFSCRCGQRLEAEPQHAGMDVQCPVCGTLVTIPMLSDLGRINATDGTYNMETQARHDDPARLARLTKIYGKARVDEWGDDLDLRGPDGLPIPQRQQPPQPGPTPQEQDTRDVRPRYDPITGELIRPVDVAPPRTRAVLPAHTLGRPIKKRKVFEPLERLSPLEIATKMLEPQSMTVLAIIILAHVFLIMALMVTLVIWMPVVAVIGTILLLLAHYGNVVEETGSSMKDELPRPMRELNWVEDFWSPIGAMIMTLGASYGPAVWILTRDDLPLKLRGALAAGLVILGCFAAPAVLLISCCSGSYANLRPDIVWATIRGCGRGYFMMIGSYLLGVGMYVTAMVLTFMNMIAAMTTVPGLPWYLGWLVTAPLLIASIFTIHFHLWMVGRAYRVYYGNFPWLYQGKMELGQPVTGRAFQVIHKPRIPGPPPQQQ